MKTKAQNLVDISDKLSKFKVPAIEYFLVAEWLSKREEILQKIYKKFGQSNVAVRSSAANEDGGSSSQAGVYKSILNIPAFDRERIIFAINEVISSYGLDEKKNSKDEVMIQEMVVDVLMSGVIFTHDFNTGAPYYVINYDDVSGLTNTVTSGYSVYSNRTIYIHRQAFDELRSLRFRILLDAVAELERVFQSEFIDVEFAIGVDLTPFLLQVRLITTNTNWNRAVAKKIDAELDGIKKFVRDRFKPVTGVYGDTTVFGQMPDWNPAEMIGRSPRKLAYSLYKTLITDKAWRKAREMMGYAVPQGHSLMVSLAGQPFIDARLSFHSYLPSSLKPEISEKLVNLWVKNLKEKPEFHDKIEFEIAITSYCFDIDEKINNLIGDSLNIREKDDFKLEIKKLTHSLLLDDGESGITSALDKLSLLTLKQDELLKSNKIINIKNILHIIEDCIELGTIPFAILARHAFIARSILLSLTKRGIFSVDEVESIQSQIQTIASDLLSDIEKLRCELVSISSFMKIYGHLRPGTYDILSKRYDEMEFFNIQNESIINKDGRKKFQINDHQKQSINNLLMDAELFDIDAEKLLTYIKKSIKGREYGKFVFTKSVSHILQIIASYGKEHGLSLDELSHISIQNFLEIPTYSHVGSSEEHLRSISETEAIRHAISAAIRLPQILFDEEGVHIVPFQVSHPNFITSKKITNYCVHVTVSDVIKNLAGKIILIENADPGFDWIFSQNISGLITKYGGVNSHMAIRCAEFGIPAAIGCGEQRFELLLGANQIQLDCASCTINPIF